MWLHVEPCRLGAAHDLVVGRPTRRVEGHELDELQQRILALSAQSLSDARVSEALDTTEASARLLREDLWHRLNLTSERHVRGAAAEASTQDAGAPTLPKVLIDELFE